MNNMAMNNGSNPIFNVGSEMSTGQMGGIKKKIKKEIAALKLLTIKLMRYWRIEIQEIY